MPTGFLHLLPEVVENMDSAFDELLTGEQDYPFAFFVVCVGFLMVLIIEHLVLSCEGNKQNLEQNEASIRSGLPGIINNVALYQFISCTCSYLYHISHVGSSYNKADIYTLSYYNVEAKSISLVMFLKLVLWLV